MIHKGRDKKPIICLTNGVRYDSIGEAAEALKIHYSGISRSIIRDIPVKGYEFKECIN